MAIENAMETMFFWLGKSSIAGGLMGILHCHVQFANWKSQHFRAT